MPKKDKKSKGQKDRDGEFGVDNILPDIKRLFLEDESSRASFMDVLFRDEDVMEMPDPEYIIDGWVPRGFFSMVYGEPGVMKTFALLGMSRAVRKGTRWQDYKTMQGSVLFFQGEGLTQLKQRIRAWDSRYPKRSGQKMMPGAYVDEYVNLTKVEGVVAVVRTVREYEQAMNTKVELLVIDPLVEFMNGNETEDGMDKVTRGIRALAKYLDIGVVVGHHTNAAGDRARGTDHHRMRAGAYILMERLEGGKIGMVQHKQKNAEALAAILEPRSEGESLVLEWTELMMASDYVARKMGEKKRQQEATKADQDVTKRKKAEDLLLNAVKAKPGMSRTKLLGVCKGQGVGSDFLEGVLNMLAGDIGKLRFEEGPRKAQLYYLAE